VFDFHSSSPIALSILRFSDSTSSSSSLMRELTGIGISESPPSAISLASAFSSVKRYHSKPIRCAPGSGTPTLFHAGEMIS